MFTLSPLQSCYQWTTVSDEQSSRRRRSNACEGDTLRHAIQPAIKFYDETFDVLCRPVKRKKARRIGQDRSIVMSAALYSLNSSCCESQRPLHATGLPARLLSPKRAKHPRPLSVFDIERRRWSEESTRQIGWAPGFYDYPPDSTPDATADDAFGRLENEFPTVRDRIRSEGYDSWTQHSDVLVSCCAMMAAGSPLFRAQTNRTNRAKRTVCAQKCAHTRCPKRVVCRRYKACFGCIYPFVTKLVCSVVR